MKKIIPALLMCISLLAGCSENSSSSEMVNSSPDSVVSGVVSGDTDSGADISSTTTTTTTTATTTTTTTSDIHVDGLMMSLDYFKNVVKMGAVISVDDYKQYQHNETEIDGVPALSLNLFNQSATDKKYTLYVISDGNS